MPDEIKVIMASSRPRTVSGNAGLMTQLPGGCITADAIGYDLGGNKKLIQTAIDKTKHYK